MRFDYNQRLVIGEAFAFEGNGTVCFSNCTINGRRVDGTYTLTETGVSILSKSEVSATYFPKQVELKPVLDQNGKEFRFPFWEVPAGQFPEVFAAKYVVDWLHTKLECLRGEG